MSDDAAIPLDSRLAEAAAVLRNARRVCVLTGAGVSAESGIPTFRDALTGLWANFSPEDLATPEAFERDPAFVWAWYEERRRRVAEASPNAGHRALVGIESRVPALTLVTQNVDGLHQRAGSRNVHEYHGNLMRDRCTIEGTVAPRAEPSSGLPRCARCGGLLRPDVVWFGETLPPAAMEAAYLACKFCDVFLTVGTSAVVYPAAGYVGIAAGFGAYTAEINAEETAASTRVDLAIRGKSGDIQPRVMAALARE